MPVPGGDQPTRRVRLDALAYGGDYNPDQWSEETWHEDIRLMRQVVGPEMGVKASGGVRNTADAQAMLGAGATRLGASASVAIVTGGTSKGGY